MQSILEDNTMNKINGYTEEEARNLVEFIKAGKGKGKTLTYLFEAYGAKRGRAKGSVRNYYYNLMKNERGDERIVRLLDGSTLSVEKIREFTEEETEQVLRSILAEKSKGLSVRRAIYNLSGGDDKLMLRLQNKYRNTLKKDPERIALLAEQMQIPEAATDAHKRLSGEKRGGTNERKKGEGGAPTRAAVPDKDFLRRRLENEINALYDRLARSLKEENERLKGENERLKEENTRLRSNG